jgi:hypothetical protein
MFGIRWRHSPFHVPMGFTLAHGAEKRLITATSNMVTTPDIATAATVSIDFEEMAAEQKRCPETQNLLSGTSPTITFKQADIQRLVSDVSAGIFNPKVWSKFQSDIFFLLHIPHPGRLASLFIVSSRYEYVCRVSHIRFF